MPTLGLAVAEADAVFVVGAETAYVVPVRAELLFNAQFTPAHGGCVFVSLRLEMLPTTWGDPTFGR